MAYTTTRGVEDEKKMCVDTCVRLSVYLQERWGELSALFVHMKYLYVSLYPLLRCVKLKGTQKKLSKR